MPGDILWHERLSRFVWDSVSDKDAHELPVSRHDQFGVGALLSGNEIVVGRLYDGRYSPPKCIGARIEVKQGDPDSEHISTSYAERVNLTASRGLPVAAPSRWPGPASYGGGGDGVGMAGLNPKCVTTLKVDITSLIRRARVVGQLQTNNQFGPGRLDMIKEAELCVPAATF